MPGRPYLALVEFGLVDIDRREHVLEQDPRELQVLVTAESIEHYKRRL